MKASQKAEKVDGSNKALTRERILEAAEAVFSEKGFHETAIDEIVKASGTSKGSVYFYFSTKEEIFFALVDRILDRLASTIEIAASRKKDGLSKVMAGLEAFVELCSWRQNLAKIVLVGTVGLGRAYDKQLIDLHPKFASMFKGYMDQAVAEEAIPPIDTDLASYVWLGAIGEITVRWLYTGTPKNLASILPQIKKMMLGSLYSREALRD